jgi:hypothetical protein
MIFWIAILAGALFVWLTVRRGFYETWVMLFNILVAMYISVFLAPVMARFIPMPGGAAWCTALCMLVLAGGVFALLHGLSWVFLTGQFSVHFPRLFDIVFSGLLGFAAGFLILSFAALTLSTTPLMKYKIVTTLGLGPDGQKANIAGLARGLDLIHAAAGFTDGGTTEAAVDRLLQTSDDLAKSDEARSASNDPNAALSPKPQERPRETPAAKPPAGLHRRSIPSNALGG